MFFWKSKWHFILFFRRKFSIFYKYTKYRKAPFSRVQHLVKGAFKKNEFT